MKIPSITPVKISNSVKKIGRKAAKFLEAEPQKNSIPNYLQKSPSTGLTTDQLIDLVLRNI